ncbi:hypothetical protein [Aeromicrobium sp. Leaf291]|uniref:hypothetical protein n=1 Tax=Aeromicrobium sp. Leaf291 TaxID=1736325 RepID=UPI0006F667E8|nr:hypothetical protein [Aeromicrobium sp. Leaf291]KQP81567.1 hypothetical protein ASF35_16180 [Aeromicrobium sp. Leaf291]
MWDSTPWFIAGGKHGPEVARLVAYNACGGVDGVTRPGDLKVRPSSPAAQSVVLSPGATSIVNRSAGAASQAYSARKTEDEVVPLTPTPAGSARTDLICVIINDPEFPGYDSTKGGVYTLVVEGVPADTTRLQAVPGWASRSGYAVAAVTRPANTGTATAGHIRDLRRLSQPRSHRDPLTYSLLPTDAETLTSTSATGEQWPDAAGWNVQIPEWATRVKVVATWYGVRVPPGNLVGRVQARLGLVAQANAPVTQEIVFDTPNANNVSRDTWGLADDLPIPAELRGTTVYAHLRGRITASSGNSARVSLDNGSSVVLDLQWVEEVE